MWEIEHTVRQKGYSRIAGIDEAGRGPLAGPVVSAAVILPADFYCRGITDSKKLSEKKRRHFFPRIMSGALAVGVGVCTHQEIDRINVLQAALLSMKRAVDNLDPAPDFLLVDGRFPVSMDIGQQAVVKGDSRSISIAAASIIAKVTRDRIMTTLDQVFPAYGFIRHKGYPTAAHRQAILDHGPCPVHRMTFTGVVHP
ncbi:MAG TPA: ribonuclease HII [Desulfotignum sp.]|jgi:ribonuclease HII|nr:ribonuclease HII [Desulfotignum sp.]